jgi:hypothetical protein
MLGRSINVLLEIGIHFPSFETAVECQVLENEDSEGNHAGAASALTCFFRVADTSFRVVKAEAIHMSEKSANRGSAAFGDGLWKSA